MLEFFRKYQRYFFAVIAVVIVISFSFFGVQRGMNAPQKVEDRCVGHAVDGSKIMQSELMQVTRFISSDQSDVSLMEKGMMPNFFNDGVVRYDLLKGGLALILAGEYFEDLKEELSERMVSHKGFRPYAHPTVPLISVENLWEQVLPSQKRNLERFLNDAEEMNLETFSLLVDLYLGETELPPSVLREYLTFQQRHYDWIEPDPALQKANLHVFKCRSLEEWFGRGFIKLSAQFLVNAAAIAKEKGFKVSYEEARVDLIRNGYEALQAQARNREVSREEISALWERQLRYLGMSEKEAVGVWQKVLLFRRLFKDVGGAVFVDPHLYQTFYSFASKTADIDLYHLPEELNLKDFSSLMKLELYLDEVAPPRQGSLLMPNAFKPVEEIEKRCPEFVERRFLVEVASVSTEEIALNVGLKEMWEWQLEEDNYALLEKTFPELAIQGERDGESYYAALEGLTPQLRQRVDCFSRGQIVTAHPEWVEEALNEAHLNVREVSLCSNGEFFFLEGIQRSEALADLLSIAAFKEALETNSAALEAKKKLEAFTVDGEVFYRFHLLDRDLNKRVLTFAESLQRGILDRLLEEDLEDAHPKVRTKNPAVFKTEDNKWKPLSAVRNEVGRILHAPLLEAIEKEVSQMGVSLSADRHERLDEFYPKYRFFAYMYRAQKDIREKGKESVYLANRSAPFSEGKLSAGSSLKDQWALIKESKVFKNHERNPWFSSDVFAMVEKSWSDVAHRAGGHLSFFQLQEKAVPSGNFNAEMKQGQEILSKEAGRFLMTEVVKEIQEKGGIQLADVDAQGS